MKLSEIAEVLGVSVQDLINFDQTLTDDGALRMAVLLGYWDTVDSYDVAQDDALDLINAYADADPHNTHGSIA